MKSIKVLALIIGAIALLPSASFAGTATSGNEQVTNLDSTTIGNGNFVSTATKQTNINLQKTGRHAESVNGSSQLINAATTTLGDRNHVVQKAAQTNRSHQKAK
jgi:uncharacterized protein YoxC